MNKDRIIYKSDDILYSWNSLPESNDNCAVVVLDPTFKDVVIVDVEGLNQQETNNLIQVELPKLLNVSYKVDRKIGNTYFASYADKK